MDPESYLGYNPHSPLDPGGDVGLGPTWAQTQAMVGSDLEISFAYIIIVH